jgi:hypothetical protein
MRKYKIDMLQYSQSGSCNSMCGDITFFNTGGASVTLNNAITLFGGQSITFSANRDELDTTNYFFIFEITPKPTQLTVFRKIFV